MDVGCPWKFYIFVEISVNDVKPRWIKVKWTCYGPYILMHYEKISTCLHVKVTSDGLCLLLACTKEWCIEILRCLLIRVTIVFPDIVYQCVFWPIVSSMSSLSFCLDGCKSAEKQDESCTKSSKKPSIMFIMIIHFLFTKYI